MEGLFDDHPSLDASLRDFEPGSSELEQSPLFGNLYPSHHSGFRSEDSESEMGDSMSGGGYSPPAWRRTKSGSRSSGFWERNKSVLGERNANIPGKRSGNWRSESPPYDSGDEGDVTLAIAARTKLPTGSLSPEKRCSQSPYPAIGRGRESHFEDIKEESPEPHKPSTPQISQHENCKPLQRYCHSPS